MSRQRRPRKVKGCEGLKCTFYSVIHYVTICYAYSVKGEAFLRKFIWGLFAKCETGIFACLGHKTALSEGTMLF